MKIVKKQTGSELFVEVEGSIDTTTAPELFEALKGALNGITCLVYDFEKVDYISSAGLRVLLTSRKDIGDKGKVVVKHANQNVMDIFTMTGFDNILEFED